MPTTEQEQELYDNCPSIWTTLNGVNGRLFIGPNGNTLFLPATGIWSYSISRAGLEGYYWSRTLHFNPNSAYYLFLWSPNNGVKQHNNQRSYGLTVRAVRVP